MSYTAGAFPYDWLMLKVSFAATAAVQLENPLQYGRKHHRAPIQTTVAPRRVVRCSPRCIGPPGLSKTLPAQGQHRWDGRDVDRLILVAKSSADVSNFHDPLSGQFSLNREINFIGVVGLEVRIQAMPLPADGCPLTPGKNGCGRLVETDGNGAVKPENPDDVGPTRNAIRSRCTAAGPCRGTVADRTLAHDGLQEARREQRLESSPPHLAGVNRL